jgi:hypothetical protein
LYSAGIKAKLEVKVRVAIDHREHLGTGQNICSRVNVRTYKQIFVLIG